MTEEEQLLHDSNHVVLLEALGNGRHEDSYEYIISHLNSTNSHWVKRAGIHALRNYHNSNVSRMSTSITTVVIFCFLKQKENERKKKGKLK